MLKCSYLSFSGFLFFYISEYLSNSTYKSCLYPKYFFNIIVRVARRYPIGIIVLSIVPNKVFNPLKCCSSEEASGVYHLGCLALEQNSIKREVYLARDKVRREFTTFPVEPIQLINSQCLFSNSNNRWCDQCQSQCSQCQCCCGSQCSWSWCCQLYTSFLGYYEV